jgi:excisionase family DNA binding protein
MTFRQLSTVAQSKVKDLEKCFRMNRVEAARYLGTSDDTLARLHARGEGPPCMKIGRRWSYRRSDLDAWKGTGAA